MLFFYESDYKYYDFSNIKSKDILIRGWFESKEYFDCISETIKKELVPKEIPNEVNNLANYLSKRNSICLTVRRGNFTSLALRDEYLVCSNQYYCSAVKYLKDRFPDSLLYICSDDIDWCKTVFKFEGEVLFESEERIPLKLFLMSQCSYFVISNSTFSWWAQYLSSKDDKVVIAPNVWRNCELPPDAIFDDSWIKMDSDGSIVNTIIGR